MDHHQYQTPPPPSQQQPPPPQNGEYQLRNDLRAMLPNASISFGGGVGPMGTMMNNRDHHPPPHSRPQQQQAMPPPPGFQQDQQQMLQRPDRRQEAQHFFGEFLKNAATHTTEKEHGQEGKERKRMLGGVNSSITPLFVSRYSAIPRPSDHVSTCGRT
jgi:hypothetical protein